MNRLCFLFIGVLQSLVAEPVTFEVAAGKFDRPAGTICSVSVEGLFPDGATGAVIRPGNTVAQIASGTLYYMTDELIKAGQKKRYTAEAAKVEATMSSIESDVAIELSDQGRSILRFVKTPTAEAKNHDPVFTRTGYIHPLFSPAGKEITGDYPADHVHQHALFFAWTKTTFEGRKPEFWNQKIKKGRVRYVKTNQVDAGPLFAGFITENLCEDLTAENGAVPVLKETWTVRSWKSDGTFNLVDIEIEQKCATESPLTIEKYHYGGMAMRGNDQWLNPPAEFLTSEGKGRIDGNHSQPGWVSLHGPLDGGVASVTVVPDPGNFRHPQYVRLHPSKPYFVFAPMVEEAFQITPGDPYRAKFRYLIQDKVADPAELEMVRRNYGEPPVVTLVN